MEISEKLDIFFRSAIDAANEESEAILGEQTRIYDESLVEYEKLLSVRAEAEERQMRKRIEKEINRTVSETVLQQKKDYHYMLEQCREELFANVKEKLRAYRGTKEYRELLIRKIDRAKALAKGEECRVSLDAGDAQLFDELNRLTGDGCSLTVGRETFGGGIRAAIPSKNLLLDESFDGKLEELRETYSF